MRRISVTLMLVGILSISLLNTGVDTKTIPVFQGHIIAQTITPPITITCNENFTALGVSGAGTPTNPYRIEEMSFKLVSPYTNRTAILIADTTAHFVIQNCDIKGYTESEEPIYPDIGINLRNVSNGVVRENEFSEVMFGISIGSCHNILLEGNNFTGIPIQWMDYDTMGTGIHIGGGSDKPDPKIEVRNNYFENCSQGVYVNEAKHFRVKQNAFISCGAGIVVGHLGYYGRLELNQIRNCSVTGIQCLYAVGTIITNNTCSYNRQCGIWLDEESSSSLVSHNLIDHNGNFTDTTGAGIWVDIRAGSGNNVTMNDLISNVDNVINDNNGTEYNLNYFSDYLGSDEDGDGIGEDPYPIWDTWRTLETSDPHPRVLRITQYLELIQTKPSTDTTAPATPTTSTTTTTPTSTIPNGEFSTLQVIMVAGVAGLIIMVIVIISKRR